MALSLSAAAMGYAPMQAVRAPAMNVRMESKSDLVALSEKLNPVVGFWDPLNMVSEENFSSKMGTFSGIGDPNAAAANIGWLRQAEIKHGRVAMAAFVGYIVHANHITFPWAATLSGTSFADISAAGGPEAQWDAVPTNAKWQIFAVISFLELWDECARDKHYTKGGKPGAYPSFAPIRDEIGHPNLDLFDPFGFSKNVSQEKKDKGLLIEINNGRLAMIGIMAFVSESRVPGSVPGLSGVGLEPYSGDVMAPWSATDTAVPLVKEMLTWTGPWGGI